jgi:hypothetical protein
MPLTAGHFVVISNGYQRRDGLEGRNEDRRRAGGSFMGWSKAVGACGMAVATLALAAAARAAPAWSPKDLTGVWQGGPPPKLDIPYNAEYAALYKQRLSDAAAGKPYDDPAGRCVTSGMPATMLWGAAYPGEFFQSRRQITLLKENGSVRRIRMRADHDSIDDTPTYMGDSIGHWDGDTLVVDTTRMRTDTVLDRRLAPHSDALHIVERFRRTAYDTIEDEITIKDPKAFTRDWVVVHVMKRRDDWELREFICQDNNRYVVRADGTSTIKGLAK